MFNDQLNEHCVKHIFSFLSPADFLNTEKVCKQWKFWTIPLWSRVTSLNYGRIKEAVFSGVIKDVVKDILERCDADQIQEFICLAASEPAEFYEDITSHCKHLSTLVLSRIIAEGNIMSYFATNCTNLKNISITELPQVSDDNFTELFSNNPNLKFVFLSSLNVKGKCLKYLPSSVTVLRLSKLFYLEHLYLNYCLCHCNIISLHLDDCGILSDECLRISTRGVSKMEHLLLIHMNMPLQIISDFISLRRLYLFDNKDSKIDVIKIIGESCLLLEELGIGGGYFYGELDVKMTSFVYLSNLSKLRKLLLKDIKIITSEFVQYMRNETLQTFCILDCSFDDAAALHILQTCKNLTSLDINYCNITTRTIANAVMELDKQPKRNTVLKLKCEKEYVEHAMKYKHRFLETSSSNSEGFRSLLHVRY